MTIQALEEKLAELQARHTQAIANANALSGAMQFCQLLIDEETKATLQAGIPVEQLFPGATVSADPA